MMTDFSTMSFGECETGLATSTKPSRIHFLEPPARDSDGRAKRMVLGNKAKLEVEQQTAIPYRGLRASLVVVGGFLNCFATFGAFLDTIEPYNIYTPSPVPAKTRLDSYARAAARVRGN